MKNTKKTLGSITLLFIALTIILACTTVALLLRNESLENAASVRIGAIPETWFACEFDADCVYTDNSMCPWQSMDTVQAINKNYKDAFEALRVLPPGNEACTERAVVPTHDPKCINNVCTIGKN